MAKAKTGDPKPAAADAEPTKGEGEGATEQTAGEATPDASTAAPSAQPTLGSIVRYNQLRNGPKIEPCVAIITGFHTETCVDLFVMSRGHVGSANTSVPQGTGAGCWELLP